MKLFSNTVSWATNYMYSSFVKTRKDMDFLGLYSLRVLNGMKHIQHKRRYGMLNIFRFHQYSLSHLGAVSLGSIMVGVLVTEVRALPSSSRLIW